MLGTNKGQSVWGSLAAAIAFWRARRVDRKQARYAFPLGLVGALAGASVVLAIPKDVLEPIVIAMLIGAAVAARREEADARPGRCARGRSRSPRSRS